MCGVGKTLFCVGILPFIDIGQYVVSKWHKCRVYDRKTGFPALFYIRCRQIFSGKNRKKVLKYLVGYQKRCTFAVAIRSEPLARGSYKPAALYGQLAQLVQSISLTRRGSGVRIPHCPRHNGSLAQLNRAFDYGSKGCRFESCRSHYPQSFVAVVFSLTGKQGR